MSTLYLATDADSLARKLAELLEQDAKRGDFFAPVTVVVPNRYLGQWLRLWLARRMGVAINLRSLYLENALWEMLRAVDLRPQPSPPELLDHNHYRLMVLSALWEDGDELKPLHAYIHRDGRDGRSFWRRSWHLADRLARFIRDYEYHRQDMLIQKWLKHQLGYPDDAALEKSQRVVFERIVRLPDGKRAVLEAATGKVLKTLPQYAMELMEQLGGNDARPEPLGTVHLFGITQISALHIKTLHWLSAYYELRFYHLNPLLTRLELSGASWLPREIPSRGDPAEELLSAWGRAGVESLRLLEGLCRPAHALVVESVPPPETEPTKTVLHRLQDRIRGKPDEASRERKRPDASPEQNRPELPLPQDMSVQIAACPGAYREIETVYNSILSNLQHDQSLKQTDIAVLVTDLVKYRPILQAVFDREQPRRLHYNLANVTAGASAFGQALLGFFDLALETFTRSQVFAVLLNPCVLARMGVERAQALTWLGWAEELGIYHGWDQRDKQERGYAATPLFSWRLGLQRLRLGRLMETSSDRSDEPAPRFRDVIPYADLASTDKEELDAFCRAVEGLLPCLYRLRSFQGTGGQWAGEIQKLVQSFLAVPPDRPEEAQVRDRLLQALGQLPALDELQTDVEKPRPLPLPLIREFVRDNLEALEGARGEILTGGVTIAALPSVRPVPFRIIYVVGLGEELFPGPNNLSTFDLRSLERLPGDIRPAETNRFLFLETLLAARDKVYLLYNSRELQRDQELQMCVPLAQLGRFLQQHITGAPFQITQVPLTGSDVRYLVSEKEVSEQGSDPRSDVLANYNETDRLLALADARQSGCLLVNDSADRRIRHLLEYGARKFEPPANVNEAGQDDGERLSVVTISELKRFLLCPAEAALRRHLRLREEEEIEIEDEEPFWSNALKEYSLMVRSLESFVRRAIDSTPAEAEADWLARFSALYDEWRLRCKVPEGVFGELEKAELSEKLRERLTGAGGLADFVRIRPAASFVGPILIGESTTPVHAHTRFPALKLQVGANLYVASEPRLMGAFRLAWRSAETLELLVVTNKSGDRFSDEHLSKPLLEPLLFMLAVRAGEEKNADGFSSAEWLGRRAVHVHVAHGGGIARFTYLAKDIKPKEAREYLTRLVIDFLNANSYDLLPFELIARFDELRQAYTAEKVLAATAEDYPALLQDYVEQDRENEFFSIYRAGRLMGVVDADVPSDAFDKVRRRFHLLDIGPARNRAAAPEKKPKGKKNARVRSGPARGR